MQEKIRTAVIGCGRRGNLHLAGITKDPRYSIEAICDLKDDAMEAAAVKFSLGNVKRYNSFEKMLTEVKPEMVVQALWPEWRLPVMRACVENGVRHLVSEKPFAPSWDDAVSIKQLAESSDCRLSYTHQRRFSPGNLKVRELLAKGVIGDIIKIDMFAFRHLLDCGTHSLDQVWSYIGDVPVDWVMGSLDLEGQVKWFDVPGEGSFAGTIMYANGIPGSIYLGCRGQEKRPDQSGVTLYGTRGFLELGWEGKVYRHFSAVMPEELEKFAGWSEAECCGDNIGNMWKNLADCYLTGKTDELEWKHGYAAAEVIFALYESVRSCKAVTLPLNGKFANPLTDIIARSERN